MSETTTLIVDSDKYAEHGIETLFFPGGEPHVKIPPDFTGKVLLFLKLRTWSDTGIAACLLDALARNPRITKLDVFIPYFPGARQDRTEGLAPLTVHLMSQLLARPAQTLHVFDPHSCVLAQHAHPARSWMPADLELPVPPGLVGVIAPDKGAIGRAEEFRRRLNPDAKLICCGKRRDPTTGKLSGYTMPPLERGGDYLIVDDICDGGGTFNLLAEAFGSDPIGSKSWLGLFVSHGIFSKGLNAINPRIKRIITTDSWCEPAAHRSIEDRADERLEILPLAQLFPRITGERHG